MGLDLITLLRETAEHIKEPIKFAHVVNPVFTGHAGDQHTSGTMSTLDSILNAKAYAEKHAPGIIEIELWISDFENGLRPDEFKDVMQWTRPLNRSILDFQKVHPGKCIEEFRCAFAQVQ